MSGMRDAGLVGASVALTGALGYLIWTYMSPGDEEPPEPTSTSTPTPTSEDHPGDPIEETAARVTQAEPQYPPKVEEGKTSLLHCFSTGSLEQDVTPTEGFNAVSINREDLHIEFLEIGGQDHLRPYWQKYLARAAVLVFVVDSSRADLFPTARTHLEELLAEDPLLPLVVLANKQDLAGAWGITDLHEALGLSQLGDQRKLFLIGTYVHRGEAELNSGARDARDLIVQMVCGV
ncbi:hypothetical protein NHX12_011535 [Muraenolepis orangiensis]|uniref:ADP-ribosylation factor-like protein 9 n=1 Tax=Muraenolepis orangiensis TaxID=630683 RepID=A0A9Q0DG14_9TELE|nr:hypothetical protein NHX12_011535 [Muraenolepis orangiensis]